MKKHNWTTDSLEDGPEMARAKMEVKLAGEKNILVSQLRELWRKYRNDNTWAIDVKKDSLVDFMAWLEERSK